jgi:hypothetical protein
MFEGLRSDFTKNFPESKASFEQMKDNEFLKGGAGPKSRGTYLWSFIVTPLVGICKEVSKVCTAAKKTHELAVSVLKDIVYAGLDKTKFEFHQETKDNCYKALDSYLDAGVATPLRIAVCQVKLLVAFIYPSFASTASTASFASTASTASFASTATEPSLSSSVSSDTLDSSSGSDTSSTSSDTSSTSNDF